MWWWSVGFDRENHFDFFESVGLRVVAVETVECVEDVSLNILVVGVVDLVKGILLFVYVILYSIV